MTDESGPTRQAEQPSFSQQAEDQDPGLLREFVEFLRYNKKWWLIPILLVLALLGLLVILGDTAAPLIYPLF